MDEADGWAARVPFLKSLAVCTAESRRHARTELYWSLGFAFLAVPIVILIVLLTRPLSEIFRQVLDVIGRGEMMVYAAAVCGTGLYSLRHGISGPIPDALKGRVTPLGTLQTCTFLLLIVAIVSYGVRRTSDLNSLSLNETMLNWLSLGVLLCSLLMTYIILSLKFALSSGSAPASSEQTESFSKQWERHRGN